MEHGLESLAQLTQRLIGWMLDVVCLAGLLAGPGLAIILGAFVTWLAVWYDGRSLAFVGISILCGGLAAGWLYRWRPRLAQQPLTGFCLTFVLAWMGEGLPLLCASGTQGDVQMFGQIGIASVFQASGTALVLALMVHARECDVRAAVVAEVSALQAHDPGFLVQCVEYFSGACERRAA
jgi:LytS/YehU family sensor histidine kinase